MFCINPSWAAPSTSSETQFRQEGEKELFLIAQKAFEDGFYDVAMRYIEQLFKQYPQTEKRVPANLLLGQCYFFKSQYLKAYDVFQELLKYTEFQDATLFWLGETYLKGADYSQAKKQYRQLIDTYPDSEYAPQAHYSSGWIAFEQKKFDEASKAFLTLVNKFSTHTLSEDAAFKLGETQYYLRSYEKTITYFSKYAQSYPQSTRHAESYFYIAESYYYLQDYLNSILYYAKAAETAYDNKLILMANVSLGWSYLKIEKFNLAQDYFDNALKFSQEKGILSDDVYLGQASLYSELKEYEKALEAYTQLIKTFPNSKRIVQARLGQANIFYLLEDYSKSIKAYQKIITQFPDTDDYQEILEKAYFGLAWSQLKEGDIDASVKSFQTVKNKTTNLTVKISALTQIGDAYQDVGQFEKALEVYDKILKEYSDSPYTDYVQYRQGITLLKMDNIESATLSFQSLQANFPKSKYLHDVKYYLAVAYFKKEDWISTQRQIVDFIKDLPQDNEFLAEAHYILALSYFNLNKYKLALEIFKKIIKNYPHQSAMIKKTESHIAKSYYKSGQVNEAVKRFKMLINKYPQSEIAQESLIWLGDHHMGISELNEAIAYYQVFINNFPGSDKISIVNYELGQALLAQEKYDEAINQFNRIKLDDDREIYAKARLIIAEIFSKELDVESALDTYQNIILTSPEFKRDCFVNIAKVYKNRNNYSKAIEAYKSALFSDRMSSPLKDVEVQFFIGDAYELLNQHDKALEEYFKIPYLYADEISWIIKTYLRIARIFEDDEQWNEAKLTYNKIIKYQTEESKFARERLEWIKKNVLE
jgi:TolA-binding protein